jgi:cation diffusion facilitator family transporter
MNREKKIIKASWWAVTINAALAAMKLTVGFISGSYAVIADGIDSATDIVTSMVVLLAARIINKPPNIRFAYGYQKADTVAAKILSFIIFFAGAQLAWSTIKVLSQETIMKTPSTLAIWVTIISIAGKLVLTSLLHRTGKKVDSPMLIANARNMRNDILISMSVLASLVFTLVLKQPMIDQIIALIISGFIMVSAFKIFMKTNVDLMDGIDDPELYKEVFEAVHQVKGAYNPHRVRARKIGTHYMINLDVEVNAFLSIKEAHDIARRVEKSIKSNLGNVYDVMVHVEPLGNKEEDEKFGITESDINEEIKE